MSALYHSILGLPHSGKTTFLAALWHLIDADEVSTKLVLDKLVGDHGYLNTIVDAWRRCAEVPRTSMAAETNVTIHVHAPANGQRVVLSFPDLSGESFESQFSARTCTADYVEGYQRTGGILLFVNADRRIDGMTIADVGPEISNAEEDALENANAATTSPPNGDIEWTAKFAPQQVQLVDLLQFLLMPPFVRRQRRLAVIVSAWDAVLDSKQPPDRWLTREFPFLYQFLVNNQQSFDFRVYGVSAQGGDITGDQRNALLRQTPSQRIQCVGPDADPHDLTAPVVWLSGND